MNKIAAWPWLGRAKALKLLEIFESFGEYGFALKRYGTSERRTFPLVGDQQGLVDTWQNKRYCLLKSSRPWKVIVSVMMYGIGTSYVSVHIDEKFCDDDSNIEMLLQLAKKLYSWGGIDYGYIATESEYDEKNTYAIGPHTFHGGERLDLSLPGIYWANFFGSRYVNWFGAPKFESLVALRKETLPDGGWLILTRQRPSDWRETNSQMLERTIIQYLGENAFFDKDHPNEQKITPLFAQQLS